MLVRILILLTMVSCLKNKEDLNIKILNQVSPSVSHFDPQLATGLAAYVQLGKVYETLLEKHPYGGPYDLLPALATEIPKPGANKTEYIFKIRPGVYYHPNDCFKGQIRQLKAQDFVLSFKRIADPRLSSPHFGFWKKKIKGLEEWHKINLELPKTDYSLPLAGVQALSDTELKLISKTPDLYFLHSLTTPNVAPIPQEAIDFYQNDLSNNVVGTGAFILERYIRKNSIEFSRNPNYWNKTFPTKGIKKFQKYIDEYKGKKIPFLDKIKVHIMNESHTQWLSFMQGSLDYLEIPKDNFAQAITPNQEVTPEMVKKGITLGISPSLTNVYYFAFNNKHPQLKNIHLRKAIAYAFDQQEYNKLFFNGTADLAQSVMPAGVIGNSPPIPSPYLGAQIEKAKEELKLAGFPEGQGLPVISIMIKNTTLGRQIGEFFTKELAKIGIKVKLDIVNWGKLLDNANKGKYDIFYLAWFVGLPTGFEFFNLLYGPNYPGSYNRVGYQNAEFDKLYDEAFNSMDVKLHDKNFHEMNKVAQKDIPLFPLVHAKDFFLKQGWLKNYIPAEVSGGFEQYYDVDLKVKKDLLKNF